MRQNKKDQPISDVLSNFGFAFEVFKVIAHAVMAKGGTMQHLRRIVKEPKLQRQIAEFIVPDTDQPFIGENEYLVHVGYDMPRDKAKLEAEFSEGGVSELFYGNYEWQNHSSCAGIDLTPGEKVFWVAAPPPEVLDDSEKIIAWADKQGYRPAIHLEAYAFAKANPELQRHFWIVALGSFALGDDRRDVAVLSGGSVRRVLGDRWFGPSWHSGHRFLFVRK